MTKLNFAKVKEAIKDSRGILSVVATKCEVSRLSVYNFLEKHPELNKDIQDEREKMHDFTEGKFFQAVNKGESWAISMYLKTLAKNRGYVERQEIVGTVNTSVEEAKRLSQIVKQVANEEMEKSKNK